MAYSISDVIPTATPIPALPFTDYKIYVASIILSKLRKGEYK